MVSSFLNLSEIRYLLEKHQDVLNSWSEKQITPAERTMETICARRFETQPTVKKFACKLQESFSKISSCKITNRFLINVEQVCYTIEFKINQEFYTHSFIFAYELEKELSMNLHILLELFSKKNGGNSCKKPVS